MIENGTDEIEKAIVEQETFCRKATNYTFIDASAIWIILSFVISDLYK